MRIYNAMRAQIEMPLSNGTKLVIPGNSVSGEFMPNSTIISVFMSSYKKTDVAFIISGPYEIAMLSNFAGSGEYVVSSLEEAVARFAPKADPTTTAAPVMVDTTTTPKPAEVPTTTTTTTTTGEPVETTTAAPVVEHQKKVVTPTAAPKKVEKAEDKPKA